MLVVLSESRHYRMNVESCTCIYMLKGKPKRQANNPLCVCIRRELKAKAEGMQTNCVGRQTRYTYVHTVCLHAFSFCLIHTHKGLFTCLLCLPFSMYIHVHVHSDTDTGTIRMTAQFLEYDAHIPGSDPSK